jgi:hypothetical protein
MTMADDLLAQYRRATGPSPAGKTPPPDANEYAAFGIRERAARLRIRSTTAPVNSPGYNLLLNVVYDTEGTHFMLVYTVLMVLVRGKNLQKLIFALENNNCDFIQQYDPTKWEKPTAADATVIEAIEIKITDKKGAEAEQ